MKASRIIIAVLVLMLIMPFGIIYAQETAEVNGVFVQNASSGTLAPLGDAFVLTLSGVSDATAWVVSDVNLNLGYAETSALFGDWGANPDGLEGSASLKVGDITVLLTLSEPVYDSDLATIIFTANVDNIVTSGEVPKSGLQAPDSFDTAILFITVNSDLLAGLQTGGEVRAEGLRGSSDQFPWASL